MESTSKHRLNSDFIPWIGKIFEFPKNFIAIWLGIYYYPHAEILIRLRAVCAKIWSKTWYRYRPVCIWQNSVQEFFMKNPLQVLFLEKLRFWRSFSIYKVADIDTTFSTISSHRQHAGDPKFQHRCNIRCRIRWQWNFLETRKFYHFTE